LSTPVTFTVPVRLPAICNQLSLTAVCSTVNRGTGAQI